MQLQEFAFRNSQRRNLVQADFFVHNEGTICMFHPFSEGAKAWTKEMVQLEPYQWMGHAFAVEHRFVEDLLQGIQDAGFSVCFR